MGILAQPARRLRVLLWLVAAHSAVVGLGLILQPPALLARLGFTGPGDPFFPAQGGVFHIVMAVGYALAARDIDARSSLVVFAVVVKVLATVFLVGYWLHDPRAAVVLLSGIGDGVMAVLLAAGYRSWRKSTIAEV